ncbi:hypothetical protein ABE545_23195 [Sphingobacterium faecium]|uniref:hypothetical protein n=1 Tax=Sphingobacterium faecium TaxID=34087 RepID=UPI003208DDD7
MYCSQTPGLSGELRVQVGDKGDFVPLPSNKNDALDFDVRAGEAKVVISPSSVFASEKIVYLKTIEDDITFYDIFEIYTRT